MAKEAEKKTTKEKRPTPLKRDDQAEKSRLRNKSFKSTVRTAIREFDETLSKGDARLIKKTLNEVYSLMDKGVKRGVFKLNKASRTKSRLAARAASGKVAS
jgi:small subunit ribosomal protein S20